MPESVSVSYDQPEKFTDFKSGRLSSESELKGLMDLFTAHLQQQAKRWLKDGEKLEIKFTDIDLAGAYEPWHGPQFDDIRIMKDIYPPRMQLAFRLLGADGKVISEGKRELSDLAYQSNLLMPASDAYRYDKNLLTEWLRREFARRPASAG